jgi:hypothetical protein
MKGNGYEVNGHLNCTRRQKPKAQTYSRLDCYTMMNEYAALGDHPDYNL